MQESVLPTVVGALVGDGEGTSQPAPRALATQTILQTGVAELKGPFW